MGSFKWGPEFKKWRVRNSFSRKQVASALDKGDEGTVGLWERTSPKKVNASLLEFIAIHGGDMRIIFAKKQENSSYSKDGDQPNNSNIAPSMQESFDEINKRTVRLMDINLQTQYGIQEMQKQLDKAIQDIKDLQSGGSI